MKIVADMNMHGLEDTFGHHGEIARLDGRRICRSDLDQTDALLVRSVTQVDSNLLQGTSVKFVGSATIGTDHLDIDWLESNDIAWAHAPGCNADAAAQYSLAMMWLACERLHREFLQQQVGIIGRGNVGRRLEQLLRTLGMTVVACDPPLKEQNERRLVSMQAACRSDIISLHVPLTRTGRHRTCGLIDTELLTTLSPGTILVNTSRGGVIEKHALLSQLHSAHVYAALDVWPDEPFIEPKLLDAVTVATPHVAGYSHEGKRTGTEMIYAAFCNAFACEKVDLANARIEPVTSVFPLTTPADEVTRQLVYSSCPVTRDDANIRALPRLQQCEDHVQIDSLRSKYPERHEFRSQLVTGINRATAGQLTRLGFRTA